MPVLELFGISVTLGSLVAALQQFIATTAQISASVLDFFLQHKIFSIALIFILFSLLYLSPSFNFCLYSGRFGCHVDFMTILALMFVYEIYTMLP